MNKDDMNYWFELVNENVDESTDSANKALLFGHFSVRFLPSIPFTEVTIPFFAEIISLSRGQGL